MKVALQANRKTRIFFDLVLAAFLALSASLPAKEALAVPQSPTDLTATMISTARIDLTWTDNSNNESGFRIETATNDAFTQGNFSLEVGANTTAWSDESVSAGETFYYRVTSFDGTGDSAPSNVASVEIPLTSPSAPSAPGNLVANIATMSQIDLSWVDNSNNEIGFLIERAADVTFIQEFTSVPTGPDATNYGDQDVAQGSTYYYRIKAYNGLGNSSPSNIVTVIFTEPAAPSELAGSAASPTQVSLTWNDTSNESSYRVERAANSTFTSSRGVFPVDADTSSFDDTVTAATTYYYRVFASNVFGDSAASNIVAITTPADGTLAAPTGLVATAVSSSQINLTWTDNASNETGFRLEKASNASFTTGLTFFSPTANAVSYSDTGLTASTTYYYRVFAINATGQSTASNVVNVTTPVTGVPAAPTGLAAAVISSSQINLTWTDNASNEAGFRLERASNNIFTTGLVPLSQAANAVSYSDTGLAASTTYYYRVFAINATGDSSASYTVYATTLAAGVPGAPSNLSASVSGAGINLTWTDNANNETGFRLERATNSAFTTGLTPFPLAANTSTYSDTGVTASTTYYYRVFAVNAAGDSLASNPVSVTAPAAGAVPAPTGLTAYAASATQVELAWTDNATNETGFRVERATNSGFTTGFNASMLAANTVACSDTVDPATTYYYRVFAFIDAGSSLASNMVTVTTPGTVPSAPAGLTAIATGPTSVNLTWTDNATSETGFRVERATNSGFTAGLASFALAADSTSYSDTNTVASTGYYYRVIAYNAVGDSSASNVVSVITPVAGAVAAPTGLAASVASPTQINLTWTDNAANETGFRLERAASTAFTDGLTSFQLEANATSYSDTPVNPDTTYYYRIFAINAAGDSPPSSTVGPVTTGTAPPAAPANLTAVKISSNQIDLHWTDNSSNETIFVIESATNAAFSEGFIEIPDIPADVTSYSDTSVFPGANFYYRVLAKNAAGSSPKTEAVVINIPMPSAGAPTGPSALTANVVSPTQVDLNWVDNSTNEVSFLLERASDIDFTQGLESPTVAPNVTAYSDQTVTNGTFFYRVKAYNGLGVSQPSNVIKVTTGTGQVSTVAPTVMTSILSATPTPLAVNSTTGIIESGSELKTADGKVSLVLPAGTLPSNSQGETLAAISCSELRLPPTPPAGADIIVSYDLKPNGAIFDPPIIMTLKYDPTSLPVGAEEGDLYIAFWNGEVWQSLPSTVDPTSGTVSAAVAHFTEFAVIGKAPISSPATGFNVSGLTVSPKSVRPAESIAITGTVTNNDDSPGTHSIILKINETEESRQDVFLGAGASQKVTFIVSKTQAGTYQVDMGGLKGSFVVEGIPARAQQSPSPGQKTPLLSTEVNPWLIFGIAGGLLLLVIIVMRPRRSRL